MTKRNKYVYIYVGRYGPISVRFSAADDAAAIAIVEADSTEWYDDAVNELNLPAACNGAVTPDQERAACAAAVDGMRRVYGLRNDGEESLYAVCADCERVRDTAREEEGELQ